MLCNALEAATFSLISYVAQDFPWAMNQVHAQVNEIHFVEKIISYKILDMQSKLKIQTLDPP